MKKLASLLTINGLVPAYDTILATQRGGAMAQWPSPLNTPLTKALSYSDYLAST